MASLDVDISVKIILVTRTSGAYGPLVLEYGDCFFVVVFFVSLTFLSFLSFCLFLSLCLFVFFVFFVFLSFLSFCLFCLLVFLVFFVLLSFCHHYHNHGINIYYHTNFCSNPTIFKFYHTFHHKPLPLLPPPYHNVLCT